MISPPPRPLRLSVLDQSPIAENATGGEALRNTIDLARLADRLGYHRYWLAEHHATPMLADASPEAMIGVVAGATASIRVGSGGVMLPHYSPFKVAETFSMLAGLYPGRIDLGLGRAPGSDQRTAYALQRDRRSGAPDDFPNQLAELIAYLDGTLPSEHPFASLAQNLPGLPEKPALWLLGSSPQSGQWAAEVGLPYMFADFISPQGGVDIVRRYRHNYAPDGRGKGPTAAIAVVAICAETDAQARLISAPSRMAFLELRRGRSIRVPTIETALAFLAAEGRSVDDPLPGRRLIVGGPDTVKAGIEAAALEYGTDEVMLVTITHDHQARRRSYELIAEAFGLAKPAVAGRALLGKAG
jgi:luciferase family oxidoreductase group 1